MVNKIGYVGLFVVIVAVGGIVILYQRLPIGPLLVGLGLFPLLGLVIAKRPLKNAVPDLIFGSVDTGLLTIPAIWGGMLFGVAGAIAGGVIGDALTDGIAGFFEGSAAEWLKEKGFETTREPVTTSLGKMSGCLLGSGAILTIALLFGITPFAI